MMSSKQANQFLLNKILYRIMLFSLSSSLTEKSITKSLYNLVHLCCSSSSLVTSSTSKVQVPALVHSEVIPKGVDIKVTLRNNSHQLRCCQHILVFLSPDIHIGLSLYYLHHQLHHLAIQTG